MNNDLVYRLNHVLTAEEILVAEVNKTTEMQRLRSARKELLAISGRLPVVANWNGWLPQKKPLWKAIYPATPTARR